MGAIYLNHFSSPAPGPIVFADNFNRGAGISEPLGSNWSVETNGPIINDNVARGQGSGRAFVDTSVGNFGSNQYTQFKPSNFGNGKSFDWYLRGGLVWMVLPSLTGSYLTLRVYNSNQFDTGVTVSLGDVVRIEAVGTAFTIKKNGAVVWTGTLTSAANPGQPGFRASINLDIDDFEAGEL